MKKMGMMGMKVFGRATYWLVCGFVTGALATGLAFFALNAASVSWCVPGDPGTFREWVSALGGYVAIPGFYFLMRQIRDSEIHHRRSVALQLRPTFKLGERAMKSANHLQALCKEYREKWKAANEMAEQDVRALANKTVLIFRLATDRIDFDRLQHEIEPTSASPAGLKGYFNEFETALGTADIEDIPADIAALLDAVQRFADEVAQTTYRYVTDVDSNLSWE